MSSFTTNASDEAHNTTSKSPVGPQGYLNFSKEFTVFIVTAFIVIMVAAIIGNTLVCTATLFSPNLRKATTSLFIVSLAVSDLLAAMLVVPFDVYVILNNGLWFHGEAACKLWTTTYLLTVPASNLTLLGLSIDRYLTLSQPLKQFRSGKETTRSRIVGCMTALWVYSLGFSILPMTGWTFWRFRTKSVNGSICFFNGSHLYNILVSVLHFIVPSLAMCVVYIMIYGQIRRHTRAVRPIDSPVAHNTQANLLLQRNIRAAKRIAVIVSVFLLCWLPYSILSIIGNLCHECLLNIPQEAFYVTLVTGYLNSALNPVLYSFNNRNFMDSYRRLFRAVRRGLGRVGSLK